MMRCFDVQARLSEYLDAQLSDKETQSLQIHLQGCTGCQDSEHTLRATNALLASSVVSSAAADDAYFLSLHERIAQRLGDTGAQPPETGDLFAYDAESMPRLDSSEAAGFPIPVFLLRRRESTRQDLQNLIQNKRGLLLSEDSSTKSLESSKQNPPEPSAMIAVPRDAESKPTASLGRGRRMFFAIGSLLLLAVLFWGAMGPERPEKRGELLSLDPATPSIAGAASVGAVDLGWEQISSVLEGFSPHSCASQGQGTVTLSLEIAPSGKVLAAKPDDTPLAKCLSSLLLQLQFPQSSRLQHFAVPVVVAK
jgi:hypothetical protein